ncbi:MAG TPA: AAA family ATPase, partial [Pyrinomonadaceae bacterium]
LLQSFIALIPSNISLGHQPRDKYLVPMCFIPTGWMDKWVPYRDGNVRSHLEATFSTKAKLSDSKIGKKVKKYNVKGSKATGWNQTQPLKPQQIGDIVCFGYGASRRMGEASLSEKSEDAPFASLFSENIELLNAEEWLLQADYAAHAASNISARKRAEKRRDEIKDILISLLPDVDDIKFAQITEEQSKPRVEVRTPYGWVSIKDLSLGYRTLIAWMVDLASRMFERYPDSPNPLAEPAVVLVDEIDLHLHPKWQRTLMSYLSERFPNTQFIATAHSPLVVQAASDANVVLLRREGDHVVIDNDVKDIHGWRVDQILTSDLFGLESARPPQLDPLLVERTKILSKSRLTKKDKARLEEIEAEIGALPTGETPEDMEAMDVIRRAADHLKAQGF